MTHQGDPGREDRAPLRHFAVREVNTTNGHVTPVAKTGLHCGDLSDAAIVGLLTRVTPVAKTGLHCGKYGPNGPEIVAT